MSEVGAVPGVASHRARSIRIAAEPFESPHGRALVAALMTDLDERYAADGPADGDNPEVVGRYVVRAEQVRPPAGVFLIARRDGEPVGCGALRALPGGPAGVAEIKRMYTVPAVRGQGVSRAILARLETEAAALGYHRLQLETGLRQPEAIRLYETAGYHRIPTFGQYAGDELSLCFGRDLPPA
jgi:GNAT superfamily N-acetyltransferase